MLSIFDNLMQNAMKVLIVHQPSYKVQFITDSLQYQNISTQTYAYQNDAPWSVNIMDFNGVVCYVRGIKDISGYAEFIKNASGQFPGMPFFILDESPDPETKTILSGCGANGYFSKPFVFSEIGNAIKNLSYGTTPLSNGSQTLKVADLKLDAQNRVVHRDNHQIRLRNKEFALLEYLMINRERILTRDMIIDYVWDRNMRMLSNTVDVHMSTLRKKVDAGFKNKLIHTVHCVGYKFGTDE